MRGIETLDDARRRETEFARLREDICRSGTDSLAHFDNGYTHEGGLSLQQNPDEFAALCTFLKAHEPYGTYLEIGSASGGACLFLSREVGFEHLFSVDDRRHPRAGEQDGNFRQVPGIRRFVGDSHSDEARSFLAGNLPGAVEVALIDGDHSYEGVSRDIDLVLSFSRPGTLVILHDTVACETVERAWLESVRRRAVRPVAEYIGDNVPLGIGIGRVA